MTRLIFKAADVRRVVEHSLAAPRQRPQTVGFHLESSEAITEAVETAAVLLVHDDGVYLMSNGQPRDVLDEDEGDHAYVAYARGCNPKTDADFYDAARGLVGGDDFAETLPWAHSIKKQIDAGRKEIVIVVDKNSLELMQ